MRLLIQRVSRAKVLVDGEATGEIGKGLLAFVGFNREDESGVIEPMAQKLIQLRIFEDQEGKMNLSLQDLGLSVLVVSQFTLYGETKRGNRPNFLASKDPQAAEELYDEFVAMLRSLLGDGRVATGIFRASMEVELVNAGPVTLMLER